MAQTTTITRLEHEYKTAIKTFETEINIKSLTDRINQLHEKNPKLQQLMRNSHNTPAKRPSKHYDSVTNGPLDSVHRNGRNLKASVHCTTKGHRGSHRGGKNISANPVREGAQGGRRGFEGVKSMVHTSVTPSYVVESNAKAVGKKDRNFIEANKKNAFCAQKISGFFEHNRFFSTIKESKRG